MNLTPRTLTRTALPLAALMALAALGYAQMHSSREAVRMARSDVEVCRSLSAEVVELRKLPQFAATDSGISQSVAQRIEAASANSQLPSAAILRIQPQPASRLGDSSYRVRATRIELQNVTLAQLCQFARELVDESRGLTVRDLRLWNPINRTASLAAAETWSAEVLLTQLIFSPPPAESARRAVDSADAVGSIDGTASGE
jgi:hypothetical protein